MKIPSGSSNIMLNTVITSLLLILKNYVSIWPAILNLDGISETLGRFPCRQQAFQPLGIEACAFNHFICSSTLTTEIDVLSLIGSSIPECPGPPRRQATLHC